MWRCSLRCFFVETFGDGLSETRTFQNGENSMSFRNSSESPWALHSPRRSSDGRSRGAHL
jgi:hypothetical protein